MNANAAICAQRTGFGAARRRGESRGRANAAAVPVMEAVERRVMFSAAPVGPEFPVNSYTTGDQAISYPTRAVATDSAGNFAVTWQSSGQDGSGVGVYAQRLTAAGVPQGGEFRVNTYTNGDQKNPTIAMDPAGDFVIAWQSVGQDGSAEGIYAQRYSASGARTGAEFRANTVTAGAQLQPSVAMSGTGDFVIAWASNQDPKAKGETVNYGVYAQRYNGAGVPQGGAFRANTSVAENQIQPSVTVAPGGQFVIAWAGAGQGDPGGVFAQRFDAGALKLGGEFRVNNYTTLSQGLPSIASDSAGNFLIAYTSYGQDGDSGGVYARGYTNSGTPMEASEFRVNTMTAGQQGNAQVAMEGSGAFVVTWDDQFGDGSGFGVFAQLYDANGATSGGNFHVNTYTAGDQFHPSVAIRPGIGFVIVWTSAGEDGSGFGVYAQLYAAA